MKNIDDQLFSVLSHDLKSPFNSLLGFTQLLKDNYDKYDDTKKKQIIDILHKTSVDAYRLIDNLLLWWHLQKNQLDFRIEKIVLHTFVEASLKKLIKDANKKEISLQNSIPKDVIVTADKEMLQIILYNLLSNAIKYTSTNGYVLIQAQQKQSAIELLIQDNGVGIPDDIKDKIFTFDKKVIRMETANEKGTGLGLVITKALVDKHKGNIQLLETQKGAKFCVSIPNESIIKDTKAESENQEITQVPTILIAEDDEANYFLIDALLQEFDLELEVMHVKNGQEAVTVVSSIPVSLVLMDMKMPIMDGYEATKIIKDKFPNLPIIAQTAYNTRNKKEKAFASGVDAIIPKPIDAKELYSKIVELLK